MPRVVFILGAGASRPYGLPTSKELRDILLGTEIGDEALISLGINFERIWSFLDTQGMLNNNQYSEQLSRYEGREIPKGFNIARKFIDAALNRGDFGRNVTIDNFRHKFFGSQRVSIDAFIKQNPHLEIIAKHAVAAVLVLCEREERLEGDWYQQFLEHLMRVGAGEGEFGIITFNYDRSFERYFYRAYLHNHPSDILFEQKLYKQLKIVHPYGCLGSLQGNTSPPLLGYGDLERFGYAINQMDLATPSHEPNYDEIKALLDGVDRIVFLGFGFWKENMALIDLNKEYPPEIYASAYGLPATVRKDVKAKYPKIIFGDRDEKVLDFILNNAVFT